MPRKKNIDLEELKISKITESLIEVKDCLGVNLVLNTPFSQAQLDVLDSFYKFQVTNRGLVLRRPIKNSWKGLVMMLVSLTYCKFGDKVVSRILKQVNQSKLKRPWRLRVDFSYEYFINEPEREEMQRKAIPYIPTEDIGLYFQNRKEYQKKLEEDRKRQWKELLSNRAPDPTFEIVSAPDSWRPCYISGSYEPQDIWFYLQVFSQLLDLDIERSKIHTEYSKTLPRKYITYPAVYCDDSAWTTDEKNF